MAFKPNDLLKIQQAKDLVAQGEAILAAHDYLGAVDKLFSLTPPCATLS